MRNSLFLLIIGLFLPAGLAGQDLTRLQEQIDSISDPDALYEIYDKVIESEYDVSNDDLLPLSRAYMTKAEEIDSELIRALALRVESDFHYFDGDLEKSLEVAYDAYDILFGLGDIDKAARVDIDISIIHYGLGEFDKAVEVSVRNVEAIKESSPGLYNTLLRNAGETLRGANQLGLAASYLKEAVAHARATDRQDALAYGLNRLGVVYYQDSEHEQAKEALEESLKIAREINLDRAITMNLNDLGELYFTLEDYERCIQLYQLALDRDMFDNDRANTYINVARLYGKLGNHDEAIDYAQRGLELAESLSSLHYLNDAQKLLAESYSEVGQYRKATAFYKQHIINKDSLFKLETQRQLAEAETKYETAKKEQEIVNLSEKEALERSRKNAYRAGLIGVGTLLLVVLLLIWQLFRNKRRIELQNEKLAQLNQTKDKFFSIIAHDLRSPMIALQGVGQRLDFFIRKGRQDKLLEMGQKIDQSIDRLNHLLNNLLNWASNESQGVPNNPQMLQSKDLVESTVDLYKNIAESKNIAIRTSLSDCQIFGDRNMASTIIRNLLSNAIKFTPQEGKIGIQTFTSEAFTVIKVSDTGEGMDAEKISKLFKLAETASGSGGEEGFGLGLKLCKEFVARMNGTIEVESEPGKGTTFTVYLPNTEIDTQLKVA